MEVQGRFRHEQVKEGGTLEVMPKVYASHLFLFDCMIWNILQLKTGKDYLQ